MAEHVYKQNIEKILDRGVVRRATKLEVITIGLGPIKKLGNLPGVIWRDSEGKVFVRTKENPEGFSYDQSRTLVVRVLGGQVLVNGVYDMYAPDDKTLSKLLRRSFDVATLPDWQFEQLEPLFEVASEVQGAISPSEKRWVVLVTRGMLRGEQYLTCELPLSWSGGTPTYTKLYEGDVFVLEDVGPGKGYRIGREEFVLTHKLD